MGGYQGKPFPFLRFLAAVLVLSAGLCWSCRDPIFYDISTEVALNDPKIPGGPTPIIVHGDRLYTSNGRIYFYDKPASGGRGHWEGLDTQPPGGNAKAIALAGDTLYALTIEGTYLNSTRLYKRSVAAAASGEWIPVENPSDYSGLQSIFGAGDYLFAGGIRNGDLAILYIEKDASALTLLAETTTGGDKLSELRGLALFNGQYYMATARNGIYRFAGPEDILGAPLALDTAAALPASLEADDFVGLLPIDSFLYGIAGGGSIWRGKADGSGQLIRHFADVRFTGAMGIWQNPAGGNERFLLIGRGVMPTSTLSAYTYGYYELEIRGGELNTDNLYIPGNEVVSSVENHGQYVTSLQKNPLNGIYQVPWTENNGERPIFASSQQNGLWSYRKNGRSGNMEWNIEE
jgi:hypothetical protein